MKKKLRAGIVLAGITATAIAISIIDSRKPVPYVAEQQQLSKASTDADLLAYSAIFPAFVPHALPVADIVDIAADSAIQLAPPVEENEQQPDESDDSASKGSDSTGSLSVASAKASTATDTKAVRLTTSSQTALSTASMSSQTRTRQSQKLESAKHKHLRQFRALLRPAGFSRPAWQDMGYNANFGPKQSAVDPFIVMIDPGHGGTDPGTIAHNGLLEKNLTLDIARRVRLFLSEVDNIDVQLTRSHDHGLSRLARVNAVKHSKADMMISLHFNHLPQANVNLVESYYAGPDNIEQSMSQQAAHQTGKLVHTALGLTNSMDLSFTRGSARLAKSLQEHVFSEVSYENTHVLNAGVKRETMFVLTRSFRPGALLEISCLSHEQEAERLLSEEYRNRLAAALVDGIRSYYDSLQRFPLTKRGDIDV